jgi:hypothetical protein
MNKKGNARFAVFLVRLVIMTCVTNSFDLV